MKKSEIYKEEGVNLASKVPPKIASLFRKQAKQRKQFVKTNLAAAAEVWTCLPMELQSLILCKPAKTDLYNLIVNWIRDQEINTHLSDLSSKQKAQLLALVRETK